MAKSRVDEIILLRDKNCSVVHSLKLAPARCLMYTRTRELLHLLGVEHVLMREPSNRSVDSVVESVLTRLPGTDGHAYSVTALTQSAHPAREEADVHDDGLEFESEDATEEFTHTERAAGTRIVAAYRKYLERKAADKDRMTELRRRVLKDYRSRSETMVWHDPKYRMLFRVAVPRLFLAVERITDRLDTAKAKVKARLSDVEHEELEIIRLELDEVLYVAVSFSECVLT